MSLAGSILTRATRDLNGRVVGVLGHPVLVGAMRDRRRFEIALNMSYDKPSVIAYCKH